MMDDIIVVAVLAAIIGAAIVYIINAKKKGARCIGCSAAGSCASSCKCSEKNKI